MILTLKLKSSSCCATRSHCYQASISNFYLTGMKQSKIFEKAYHLDHNRKEQNQFLETTLFNRRPFYEDVVLYYKQIERYLKVFNRSQIEIILLDELIANPKSVLNHLLSWLGVDKHETQFSKSQ